MSSIRAGVSRAGVPIVAPGPAGDKAAKAFGAGRGRFHDAREWAELLRRYGPMTHLLTPGGA